MLTEAELAVLDRVDVAAPWALLQEICAFPREHPDDVDRSVGILAGRLRAAGVPAVVGQMDLYLSLPGPARIEAGGVRYAAKVSAMSPAIPDGLRARLVHVHGGKDLMGSLLGGAQDVGDLRDSIPGSIVITEGFGGPGVIAAFAPLGALAVIAINPGADIHSGICTPIWGNPDLASLPRKPAIPVLNVNRADGDALIRHAAAGGAIELACELEEGWFPSNYLTVEIPGTEDPDRFVLLHGHLDSWHLGVGDNGTGDVTMFEVARMLWQGREQLRRSVRIAWWPGHSTGRYAGSAWYADEFAVDIAENCVAQINCDSPGCRWATAYTDLFCMPEAAAFLGRAVKDVTGQDATMLRPFRAADWSFNNLGVTGMLALSSTMPAALVAEKGYYRVGGNGGNIEWHTDRDTMEIADPAVLRTDIRLYALCALRIAAAEILPFDFRAAAAEYRTTLDRYLVPAGDSFDLQPAIAACDALILALHDFYARTGSGQIAPDPANACILAFQRLLVPAHFSVGPHYQHDPAEEMPPLAALGPVRALPSMQAELLPFALTGLRRSRNQVVAAFRTATRIARNHQ